MQKLLSLPPNLVSAFYELENVDRTEWFCTSDPVGMKLGSGGEQPGSCANGIETNKQNTQQRNVSCCMPVDKAAACRDMLPPERY